MKLPALLLALCAMLATAAPALAEGALDRVRGEKTLRWGCDAQGGAPYVYLDPITLEDYVGFEVELARAIAEELGVEAEQTQNQWSTLLPGLKRGDYDVALNGIEITAEHAAGCAVSRAYYVSSLEITVPAGKPLLRTIHDLKGKRIGCLKETFAERVLKSADLDVASYEGQVDPYLDLKAGRIEGVVMDVPIARYYGHGTEFANAAAAFGEAPYGIFADESDRPLIEEIDRAIEALGKSGKLREIYSRYGIWNEATAELLGQPKEPATAGAPMLEEHIRSSTGGLTLADRAKRMKVILRKFGIGALVTLGLSAASMALAIALGITLALLRVYGAAPLRWAATFYIEAIRGTPLLIQLYIIFYGLPDLGITLPPFPAAVLGIGLNYAAYEAENYRAGLTSIALGQSEAAWALGLTPLQTIRHIIVPQALRLVIPPVTNDFIALLKDSSIVSVIGMTELTLRYSEMKSATGETIQLGLIVGVFYFLLGLPFARLAAALEARARKGRR